MTEGLRRCPQNRAHDKNLRVIEKAHFFRDMVSSDIDTFGMDSSSPAQILRQIAQIQSMERGKLSILRESADGPFYKLQAWENGKNVTRYVPREQVSAVQEALKGFAQFEELTQEYARQVIDKTRAEIAADSKKKTPRPNSSLPKTRKSSN